MQEDLPPTGSKDLGNIELQRLIAFWRHELLRGSHEAQGILYAFEAEMMRRRTSPSFSANDLTFD